MCNSAIRRREDTIVRRVPASVDRSAIDSHGSCPQLHGKDFEPGRWTLPEPGVPERGCLVDCSVSEALTPQWSPAASSCTGDTPAAG